MRIDHSRNHSLVSQVDIGGLDLTDILPLPDIADVAGCLVDSYRDVG